MHLSDCPKHGLRLRVEAWPTKLYRNRENNAFICYHCIKKIHSLQMLAKFAEDDRIEQMNAQRRRMKQLEHKRAVEKLIEERRMQYEMDKV